jgi:YgiT-type zinc finger domain-containing protein
MAEEVKDNLNPELCAFCGAPDLNTVYKDKLFGKGENAIIIENLPVRHCESCDGSYYDLVVSRLIDEILAHPGEYAVRRQINVVSIAA